MNKHRSNSIFLLMVFLLVCFACQMFHPSRDAFALKAKAMLSKGTTLSINVDDEGKTILATEEGVLSITSLDGWVTFTLSTGESIAAYIDATTGAVSIVSHAGTIEVKAGDATITVEKGEAIVVNVDPETQTASVMAVTGTVQVAVANITVTVEEGEAITADVDPLTGIPTVVCTRGEVETTSAGETTIIIEGYSTEGAPSFKGPHAPHPPISPPPPCPPPPPVASPAA